MIQIIRAENFIKKYIWRNHMFFFLFGETVLVFFQNFSSQGVTGLLFCVPFVVSSLLSLPTFPSACLSSFFSFFDYLPFSQNPLSLPPLSRSPITHAYNIHSYPSETIVVFIAGLHMRPRWLNRGLFCMSMRDRWTSDVHGGSPQGLPSSKWRVSKLS